MPPRQRLNIQDILNQLNIYKEQLKEINELEDKLNQERFLIFKDLNKSIEQLDKIISHYAK